MNSRYTQNRAKATVTAIVLALFVTSGCATSEPEAGETATPPAPPEEVFPLPETTYDTTAFEEKVLDNGGRIDFVFGDNRPFDQCHASTLTQPAPGVLLCAWFGGTEEKDPDVGIWYSRFAEGEWSPPKLLAKVDETAHWNPVLFTDPEAHTYLFFKVGPEIPYWQTYWMKTTDAGLTWTKPEELVPGDKGGRGPVKNKPIILSDGTWLAPASTELDAWKPFVDRSEDKGKTWTRSDNFAIDPEKIPGVGAIQPTLWESSPGNVHALLRTAAGRVGRADSTDGGKTWSPMRLTDLPNNNSGLDVLKLEDGRLLLVYNPIGKNWGPRTPLNLAASTDNGESWLDLVSLETEEGEYSYPAIIRTAEGVAICYTWRRERVRCWQIPLEALG
ncbi:MAG: sialidase family protein [Candidatus Hydrogenedentota bacterium]